MEFKVQDLYFDRDFYNNFYNNFKKCLVIEYVVWMKICESIIFL